MVICRSCGETKTMPSLVPWFVFEPSNHNSQCWISTTLISISWSKLSFKSRQGWSIRKSAKAWPLIDFYSRNYRLYSDNAIVYLSIFPLIIGQDSIYLINFVLQITYTKRGSKYQHSLVQEKIKVETQLSQLEYISILSQSRLC